MSQPEDVVMYDLESEWPAHNQGKTPRWLAEKNAITQLSIIQKLLQAILAMYIIQR